MDEQTRESLRKVLVYMIESEAKTYWHRRSPADREGWAYESALVVMRNMGFDDLLEEDAAVRNMYSDADEPEAAS